MANVYPNPYNLQTPLGQALGNAITATGQVLAAGPSKWDQARTQSQIDYSQAAADKARAETVGINAANAAPGSLADTLKRTLALVQRAKAPVGGAMADTLMGQPIETPMSADEAYYAAAPDMLQYMMQVNPKNTDVGNNMRALYALIPGVSDEGMTQAQLGAGQAFNTTVGGTREGLVADQTKQDSINSTSRANNADDNAMRQLIEQMQQAGQDRRLTVNTPAGSTTSLPPGSPIGKTQIDGVPTQDTVQADILQQFVNQGVYDQPNTPMVTGSPAAVLAGASSMPGTGAARTGKNWASPDGQRGVTVDGVVDQATGKPLPQGWQYSTDVNPSGVKLKAVPAGATQGMLDNKRQIDNIDKTITALDAAPGSTGKKGYLSSIGGSVGNNVLNWADPSGTDARANIANIGSMIIHDRSGAAVTISETPRLAPFVPLLTDDDNVVRTKLARLRAEIKSMLSDQFNSYSPDTGYIANPTIGQFLEMDMDPQGGAGAENTQAERAAAQAAIDAGADAAAVAQRFKEATGEDF